MNRKKFAAGDIVRANQLVNILENNNIKTNSTNIARSANLYGIKKADRGGYYIEPSKEELKKIKKEYDLNLLKQGQSEPAQKLYKEKYDRAFDLLKKGNTQSEVSRVLAEEYNYNPNQGTRKFIYNAAKDLEEKGFKIKSGREAEQGLSKIIQNKLKESYPNIDFQFDKYKYGISTNNSKYSSVKNAAGGFQEYLKERGKNIQEVSKLSVENKMNEAKRILSKQLGFIEKGKTTLDLAHRSSLKQNKELGLNYLSSNLGIDPKDINRRIIKPVEDELKNLYKQQTKLVDQAKKFESVPEEIQKKLSDINFKISEVIATTDGRLQGIHVDEKTLQPKRTGIDYSKSVDLGIFEKPVKDLSKQEVEFINKFLLPEAMKAQNISKIATKELYSKVIPGQETVFDYLKNIASDVKAGKILSPTLKVLAPVGTAIGAYDVAQSYAEGKPLPETAGAFLGVDPIIEAIREESRLTPEASEIKKRIRTEELEGREYTPGLDVLPPSNIKQLTESERQKVAAEEEQIKKQLEEERLATKEERGKVLDYVKERFSPFGEERIEMEEGGFVEFGDPETWKEKASQFINRPVHSKPIEKIKPNPFGKYASQIAETRLGPEQSLSKYKSYSELELLGNIEAKKPNFQILEENILDVMPMYNPKDIVPKGARPVMPNEYDRRPSDGILELARGGRVNFAGGGIKLARLISESLLDLKNSTTLLGNTARFQGAQKAKLEALTPYTNIPDQSKHKNILKSVNKAKENLPKEYHSILDDIKKDVDNFDYATADVRVKALEKEVAPELKFENLSKELFPMEDPLNDAFIIMDPNRDYMTGRYVMRVSVDPETGRGTRQVYDTWDSQNKRFYPKGEEKLRGVESIEKGKEGLN